MREMIAENALPADATRIVDVMRQGFDPAWLDIVLYGCSGIAHYVEAQIRLGLASPYRYKVCRQDGVIVGAAEFRILGKTLLLNNIAVASTAQGAGIGGSLLRAMVSEAITLDLRSLTLDVVDTNVRALTWYERLGLRETSTRMYLRGAFPHTGKLGSMFVIDHAQADAVHARFGFSELSIDDGGRMWKVGRIGDRYFRLVGWQSAGDPRLAELLGSLEPNRELLAVLEGAPPHDMPWQRLAVAKRMSAGLEDLRS